MASQLGLRSGAPALQHSQGSRQLRAGRAAAPGCLRANTLRTRCSAGEDEAVPQGDWQHKSPEQLRRQLEASWARQDGEALPNSMSNLWSGVSPSALRFNDAHEHLDGVASFAGPLFRTASVDGSIDDDLELWTYANPASLVFGSTGCWADVDQVYVILFGVGQSDTEGIYSLRALSCEDGLPQDTIIAFEDAEDAERYAGLLEATMDHTPSVCPIDPHELLEFCLESGYSCRLEAAGSLLMPPDFNVGVTDWERTLRLRGESMGPAYIDEPTPTPLGEIARRLQIAFPPPGLSPAGVGGAGVLDDAPAPLPGWPLPAGGLEAMRARLERLLPDD